MIEVDDVRAAARRLEGVTTYARSPPASGFAYRLRIRSPMRSPHRLPASLTFAVNRERAQGVVTVTEAQLVETIRFALERLKLVLEPSGGAALAAVMAARVSYIPGARVGLILSGGNVDRRLFGALMAGE